MNELENRLIDFATDILNLAEKMPRSYAALYFSKQLIRSGSAPALLYGEARAAESKRDFIHKLNLVLKELRETRVNLVIIMRRFQVINYNAEKLLKECGELIAIFISSINTAKKNQLSKK